MPVNLKDPINLLLKDPTYDYQVSLPIPPYTAQMPFTVIGWDGAGFATDTYAGRASQCYYVLATSIPLFIDKIGKTPKWAAVAELMVQPAGGRMFNANYDRRYLNFYFGWDDIRKKMVYSAGAIDVVAHELGHAFLDSIRPDLWNFAVPEIGAFHESISDIHGITTVMRQKKTLIKALMETGGDISKSSIISRLGEEMGTAVAHAPMGQVVPLRDGSNDFAYEGIASLPSSADRDQLSTEPHSLSRVFTGAAFEIMVGIYNKLVSQKVDGLEALSTAGETLMTYVFKAALIAPAGATMFQNVANAIAFVDHQSGGPYADVIISTFARRKMPVMTSLSALAADSGPHTIETKPVRELMTIPELSVASFGSVEPSESIAFSVPLDECRRYDSKGNIVEEHIPDRAETHKTIKRYARHLQETDRIGEGKEFKVVNNVLVRNHISCFTGGR